MRDGFDVLPSHKSSASQKGKTVIAQPLCRSEGIAIGQILDEAVLFFGPRATKHRAEEKHPKLTEN